MGPILFVHNENIAHVMPRVTAHAVTSCTHHVARARRQPAALIICGTPGNTYGRAVCASRTIFNKINLLMERILIAMLNENMAVSNENFRN